MLKRISTYLKALRGSRGFGIHSPFAFEFVLNVLRDRHPFYAYDDLKQLHSSARQSQDRLPSLRLMKLLFRISSRLDLQHIAIVGSLHPLLVKSLTMPSSQMSLNNNAQPALTVVADKCDATDNEIIDILLTTLADGGSAIIFGHRHLLSDIYEHMTHGTLFTNCSEPAVIIGLKYLPRQQFTALY